MSVTENPRPSTTASLDGTPPRRRLSLDWWAVLSSLALVLLVWGGLIRRVSW